MVASSFWSQVQRYDLHTQLVLAAQTGFAILAGAIVGMERDRAGKRAGLRTHIVVAAGAALAVGIGEMVLHGRPGDATRTFHGVLTGVGFIGAGAIIISERAGGSPGRSGGSGLTTAATVLYVAVLGAMAAFGAPLMAVFGAVACVVTLRIARTLVERPVAIMRQAIAVARGGVGDDDDEEDDAEEWAAAHPVDERISNSVAQRWLARHPASGSGHAAGRGDRVQGPTSTDGEAGGGN